MTHPTAPTRTGWPTILGEPGGDPFAATALSRYSAILLSAVLLGLYAQVAHPWAALGAIALVPWIASLEREQTSSAALANAVFMTIAFTLAVFSWFALAIARYTEIPTTAAFIALAALSPILQPQFIAFALARRRLAEQGLGRTGVAIGAACAWVGVEALAPRLFGDTLGHGVYPFAVLRQGADLVGARGLTFVVLLVNECILAAYLARRAGAPPNRALLALTPAAALIAALAVYGGVRITQIEDATEHAPRLTAALVQGNIADYDGLRERLGTYDAVRTILDRYETLTRKALSEHPQTGLVVWPETVYPTTFGRPKSDDGAAFDDRIRRFVAEIGVPLLFGAYDREVRDDTREYNAAFLVTAHDGAQFDTQVYRKLRPFPFTEAVPAWLDGAWLRSRLPWLGTWQAGDRIRVLELSQDEGERLRVLPLICRDAVATAFALLGARAGADTIVTISNDAWFADTHGARLHLVVSAFRSIETRRPQLRATNTGITAVIDPTGAIEAQLDVGSTQTLVRTVSVTRKPTSVLVGAGDWFGRAAAGIALLMLTSPLGAGGRTKSDAEAKPAGRAV